MKRIKTPEAAGIKDNFPILGAGFQSPMKNPMNMDIPLQSGNCQRND
jgi:hypothetical protein